MQWKGVELTTVGHFMFHGIDKCDTVEEAREFMRLLRKETPHAHTNIGYLAGYYPNKEKHRIFEWFQVAHPVFGTYDPKPEEAFKMGMQMAKRIRYVKFITSH